MVFVLFLTLLGFSLGCAKGEKDPSPRQVDNTVTRYGERLRGAVDDAEQVAERVNRRLAEQAAEVGGAE